MAILQCLSINFIERNRESQKGHIRGKRDMDKDQCVSIANEAICSQDLYCWHASLGFPGSMNDLNILDASVNFAFLLIIY